MTDAARRTTEITLQEARDVRALYEARDYGYWTAKHVQQHLQMTVDYGRCSAESGGRTCAFCNIARELGVL